MQSLGHMVGARWRRAPDYVSCVVWAGECLFGHLRSIREGPCMAGVTHAAIVGWPTVVSTIFHRFPRPFPAKSGPVTRVIGAPVNDELPLPVHLCRQPHAVSPILTAHDPHMSSMAGPGIVDGLGGATMRVLWLD